MTWTHIIALIPILRHEYIASLEKAHEDDSIFIKFIADRVITTQIDLLRLLNSGGVNTDNGGVNIVDSGGVNTVKDQILQAIITMPGINAPTLAITLNMSLRTIQRYVKQLSDEQKVEFRGAAKNGGYYIN